MHSFHDMSINESYKDAMFPSQMAQSSCSGGCVHGFWYHKTGSTCSDNRWLCLCVLISHGLAHLLWFHMVWPTCSDYIWQCWCTLLSLVTGTVYTVYTCKCIFDIKLLKTFISESFSTFYTVVTLFIYRLSGQMIFMLIYCYTFSWFHCGTISYLCREHMAKATSTLTVTTLTYSSNSQ